MLAARKWGSGRTIFGAQTTRADHILDKMYWNVPCYKY